MTRCQSRGRRGFTLLELLVSVGLVALLVVAMATFLSDALRVRARVGTSIDRGVGAEAAMSEIERALDTCVVDDAGLGSGVRGTSSAIEILRAGMSAWRLGGEDPARAFEPIERLTVAFDAESQRLVLGRGDRPLVRLPGQIARLRFRYHDGERWVNSFDSGRSGRLPTAVEIAVWFHSAADGDAVRPREGAAEGDDAADADEIESAVEDAIGEEMDDSAPVPDRRRVIAVPDAAGDTASDSTLQERSP